MTDIHCHILPLSDDGAQSMEDALEMARMAADSGVSAIIVTPHCNLPGEEEQNYISHSLLNRFAALRAAVKQAGIPLTLLPGAEILCTPEVPALLEADLLPSLAGSRYLLVEFFFDESLDFMDEMLRAVTRQGRVPVIAHPERYEAVQRNPGVAERWFREGYIIQLNKGSILGRLGKRAQLTAHRLLERGLAHVVASDAHSPHQRTPDMSALEDYLLELCSPAYTDILLRRNPARIAADRPMVEIG